MRYETLACTALVLLLATAGCLGTTDEPLTGASDEDPNGDDAPSSGPGGSTEEATVTVEALNTTFETEAYNSGALSDAERSLDAEVPSDAAGIVAELRWTGTADLDLYLASPQLCSEPTLDPPVGEVACFGVHVLTGEGEGVHRAGRASVDVQERSHRIEVDASTVEAQSCDEETCTWSARIDPTVAVDTDAQLRVSVFHASPPASGYTAFEDDPAARR